MMTSDEVVEHFKDMGVLDEIRRSPAGLVIFIEASAPPGYDSRCMKDLLDSPEYLMSFTHIYAMTSDGVPVRMRTIRP